MLIKVISVKNNDFYIQDTKDLKGMSERQFLKYLETNKKEKLLKYEIVML